MEGGRQVQKKAPPFFFSVHSHDFFHIGVSSMFIFKILRFFKRLLELKRSYVLRIWFSFAGFITCPTPHFCVAPLFCVGIDGGRVDRCKFEFYKHWHYLHFINVCFTRSSAISNVDSAFIIVYPLVPRIYWALMYVLQLIFTVYTCSSAFSNILGGHQLELWVGVVIAAAKLKSQTVASLCPRCRCFLAYLYSPDFLPSLGFLCLPFALCVWGVANKR